jgi:hypothetical protein
MFATVKSLQGNKCAQIYTTWFQWVVAYPISSKADAHYTLDRLHREYGIFHTIIPDNAKELTQGEFHRKALKTGTHVAPIEAYSHNQNLAESAIRELRRMFRKAMRQTHGTFVSNSCPRFVPNLRLTFFFFKVALLIHFSPVTHPIFPTYVNFRSTS